MSLTPLVATFGGGLVLVVVRKLPRAPRAGAVPPPERSYDVGKPSRSRLFGVKLATHDGSATGPALGLNRCSASVLSAPETILAVMRTQVATDPDEHRPLLPPSPALSNLRSRLQLPEAQNAVLMGQTW